MLKNYGFDETKVIIKEEDYFLGSNLPLDVVNPSGDWQEFLPVYEPQASKFETWGCTAWGTLNQIETYMKKEFGGEYNYSDRFTYLLANISPPGATPTRAYEAIRKKGVIPDTLLPYAETYEEFLQPNPMLTEFLKKGLEWHSKYKFNHEWIKNPNPDKIKEALKFSPVCVSVTAWVSENGVYVDKGQRNTHWCLAFKVEDNKVHVFDSYDNAIKVLHPDHHTKFAKRIRIVKRAVPLQFKPKKRYNVFDWFNLFKVWKINQHTS